MGEIHVYSAVKNDAHDYMDTTFDPPLHFTMDPATMLFCHKCDECWPASQMVVQCYYDGRNYWCKPGHGCKDVARMDAHRERTRLRRSWAQKERHAERKARELAATQPTAAKGEG